MNGADVDEGPREAIDEVVNREMGGGEAVAVTDSTTVFFRRKAGIFSCGVFIMVLLREAVSSAFDLPLGGLNRSAATELARNGGIMLEVCGGEEVIGE